jgi:NADPH:quinone reductase-like Zn-dependent oxidoreductase
MKAIVLQAPASLDALTPVELPDPGPPGAGAIRVRMHASSLNFHDYAIATGKLPLVERRIVLGEGSGLVEAVGPDVTEFAVGDHVITRYFPGWLDGEPTLADFSTCPGDGLDGFASDYVVRPATWFTKAPKGCSHEEAATLPVAGLTAWRAA